MNGKPNYLAMLLGSGLILVMLVSLCNTTLNSVAGVANAIAMAEMANAVQVSQYTIMLLVLALVAVPVVIAMIVWRLTANATRQQQPYVLPPGVSQPYLPCHQQRALPPPEALSAEDLEIAELLQLWSRQSNDQYSPRR
jgi:hypothetical protein